MIRSVNETRDVVRPILDYCAKAGIFARRRNVAGVRRMHGHFVRLGEKGQADIWGILRNGRHFEAEIKRPGEEPTTEQLEWLAECARAGALAFWTDSVEEFAKIVN